MNTENHSQTAAFLWSIADLLRGDLGADRLRGGDGNDTLYVDGLDDAQGGVGNDTFNFTAISWTAQDAVAPPSTGILDGGAGRDILNVDVRGAFGQDQAGQIYLSATSNSSQWGGSLGVVGDHVEPSGYWWSSVWGFEELNIVSGANSAYVSASGNMTVRGGDGHDYLEGWVGNQTMTGGYGRDDFQFAHRVDVDQGYDVILNFNKEEDQISWNDEDYGSDGDTWDAWQRHQVTVEEINGDTIYTTRDTLDGSHMHTLKVVGAVDLPDPGYFLYG